jgi:hypothetical protein
MLKFARRADPCFVISVIGFIVIVPIGFTIDHVSLQKRCSQTPVLYLNPNWTADFVPLPFVTFVQSAKKEIHLVLGSSNETHGGLFGGYYWLLRRASDQGVAVHIVTNNADIAANFSFCASMKLVRQPGAMYVFLAQADGVRGLYSSDLLAHYVCPETEYLIDFPDCRSVASDIASLFRLLQTYADSGYPTLFSHRFLPGSSFPAVHALPGGGRCQFAIAPESLTAPGRARVIDLIDSYFKDFGSNLSVLTNALFPRPNALSDDMPELLVSERISVGALNGTNIRVLLPQTELMRSRDELRSLGQFPNVEIRATNPKQCRLPTLYAFRSQSAFMPMPFDLFVKSDAVTVALRLIDDAFAAKLKDHFDALWGAAAETDL